MNYVNTRIFSYQKEKSSEDLTLLFVGRLVRKKGIHFMLDVVEELVSSSYKTRLKIVGTFHTQEYAEYIKRKVDDKCLRNVVEFIGPSEPETISSELRSADILLYASQPRGPKETIEGFPNAILEAMAVGTPVITSNFSKQVALMAHEKQLVVLDTFNVSIWASTILNLYYDMSQYDQLRENARQLISHAYNQEIFEYKLFTFIDAICR